MPSVKLEARNLRKLAPPSPKDGNARRDYFDSNERGLHLRVTESGARSFALLYRTNGTLKRYTIGPLDEWTLADAREKARDLKAQARLGSDPQAEKVAAREAEKIARKRATLGGDTLKDLGEKFMAEEGPKLRETTRRGWSRYLRVEVEPVLGHLKPTDVTRGQVRDLLKGIVKRGSPVSANRCFEIIRRVYRWALAEDIVTTDPTAGLHKLSEEKPRSRTFTNDELRSIVAALPGSEVVDLVPLMLYTGTRVTETASAKWADVDFERSTLTIPADVSKSSDPHVIPLSHGALAVLKRIQEQQESSPWLFPAPWLRDGHLTKDAVSHALRDVASRAGIAGLRSHDLRRTVADRLESDLNVRPDVDDDIQGHRRAKLRRTYRPTVNLNEARKALDRWSRHLDDILAGRTAEKVVSIDAERA